MPRLPHPCSCGQGTTSRRGRLIAALEVPVDGKDLDVVVADGVLTIRGEKKQQATKVAIKT